MHEISIITPLYNKASYIAETIRSVQAESCGAWEMIIVENASTDGGAAIAREFAEADKRIRVVELPSSAGPGRARNHGLDLATGRWVLFLDADDLLEPDYLDGRLRAAKRNPNAEIIAGCWQEFPDGHPGERTVRFPVGWQKDQAALETEAIAFAPWAVHAAITRRERMNPQRRWQEDLDGAPSEDTAFWFRVIFDARVEWAEGNGALYRTMTPSSRDAIRSLQRRFTSVCGIIDHNVSHLRELGKEPTSSQHSVIVRVFEEEYRRAAAAGETSLAREALGRAHEWLVAGASLSPGMLLRRVIGLRRFQKLRTIHKKPAISRIAI